MPRSRSRERRYGLEENEDDRIRCDGRRRNNKSRSRSRSRSGRRQNGRDVESSRERVLHGSKSQMKSSETLMDKMINGAGNKSRSNNTSSGTSRMVWGNVPKEEEEARLAQKSVVPEEEKEKANFGLTGTLAKDKNTGNIYNGVVLKWSEPLDACRPSKRWRLYVFKGDEVVETLYIHRQSAYLLGKEALVADIVLGHPTCSKQHAVIQYRCVENIGGEKEIKPYIMDLQSTNKTFLNGVAIEDSRYVELREKDMLKFGNSTREYLLLHDEVKK